jgi:hypothetical protein
MNPLTTISRFSKANRRTASSCPSDGLRIFRRGELLLGVGAFRVVHPAAPFLGQHTSSSQQARQHPEANGRPENKNANAPDTQYGKHNASKSAYTPGQREATAHVPGIICRPRLLHSVSPIGAKFNQSEGHTHHPAIHFTPSPKDGNAKRFSAPAAGRGSSELS